MRRNSDIWRFQFWFRECGLVIVTVPQSIRPGILLIRGVGIFIETGITELRTAFGRFEFRTRSK